MPEMSPSRSRSGSPSGRKSAQPQVRAAGGVVWRAVPRADGAGGPAAFEVVLVHRDRYDDWSLPKGKLDRGESYEQAALREVAEETGLVCELGPELPSTRYRDGKRRDKLVRYWAMRVVGLEPWAPNHEIDRRLWVPLDQAVDMLTYDHDRKVLAGAADCIG
jgi:8-oxo-dGTP pyrophosphatase MutT (NUDIX family)